MRHKIMPLAGDRHVVVAVVAHPRRAPGKPRHHRAGGGGRGGLRFLAAKAAAQPPHLHRHIGGGHAQQMRHQMLHLAGVLGGEDMHLPILARHGLRDLAFKVEMLLPAISKRPARRRGAACSAACASPRPMRCVGSRWLFAASASATVSRAGRCSYSTCPAARRAGRLARGGGHQKHRLAVEQHLACRQQRLVMREGPTLFSPGTSAAV
jgi:hypothetical protein